MSALVCHVLIGPPACGKSTLAQQWQDNSPEIVIVSTDKIREELQLGPTEDWPRVEEQVMKQIKEAVTKNKPVIYDATNTQRAWRLSFLQKAKQVCDQCRREVDWIGWWFEPNQPITLELCLAQNEHPYRQRVPQEVIKKSFEALSSNSELLKPSSLEGFIKVEAVPFKDGLTFDFNSIKNSIKKLSATKVTKRNRYHKIEPHY
ncbi:ATP-binding protein, partial [Synechocystis salina LEGE 06155]|nr:ATP-binding protein [Synechocystis salina LEGE 06155]